MNSEQECLRENEEKAHKVFNFLGKTYKITLNKFLCLITMLAILILMTGISAVLYFQVYDFITEKNNFIETTKLNQVSEDLSRSLSDLLNTGYYLEKNNLLIKYLKKIEGDKTDAYEKVLLSNEITGFLSNTEKYSKLIKSINVVTRKTQYCSTAGLILKYRQLEKLLEEKKPHYEFLIPDESFSRTRTGADDKSEYITLDISDDIYAKIYIFLDTEAIKKITKGINILTILDQNRNMIYRNTEMKEILHINRIVKSIPGEKNTFFNEQIDRKKSSDLFCHSIDYKGWIIVYRSENNFKKSQIKMLQVFFLIALILSSILALVLSSTLSNIILRPLKKLNSALENYNADKTVRFQNDEISIGRKLTLQDKIFLYLILTVLIPVLLFTMAVYFRTSSIMMEQVRNSYRAIFDKTASNVTEYLNRKRNVVERLSFNSGVLGYIENVNKKTAEYEGLEDIVNMNTYMGLEKDVLSIYNKSDSLIYSNYFSNSKESIGKVTDNIVQTSKGIKWGAGKDNYNRNVITIALPTFNLKSQEGYEKSGIIEVALNEIFVSALFTDLVSPGNEVFIADESGYIFSHTLKGKIGTRTNIQQFGGFIGSDVTGKNNSKYLYYQKQLGDSPLYLVNLYSYNDVMKQTSAIFINSIFLFLIILMLIIILSYITASKLLKPIVRLKDHFNVLNLDTLGISFTLNTNIDEISLLGNTFNRMTERIEELIDELLINQMAKSKLEEGKKNAEIMALQSQINPHFLYNTLDLINHSIKQREADKAVAMINALGELFRLGIKCRETIIPIEEELGYTRAYTEILMNLYNKNIDFEWDIDKNLLKYLTIKLTLQPLVENAVYHGLKQRASSGKIRICCHDTGQYITFSIEDNGTGINKKELSEIKRNLDRETYADRIGIYNVQSRIKLHFGGDYGLRIESCHGEGTLIQMTIPKTKELVQD